MKIIILILLLALWFNGVFSFGGGITIHDKKDRVLEEELTLMCKQVDRAETDTVISAFVGAVLTNDIFETIKDSRENRQMFEKLADSLRTSGSIIKFVSSSPEDTAAKAILSSCTEEILRVADKSRQRSIDRRNARVEYKSALERKTFVSFLLGPVAFLF